MNKCIKFCWSRRLVFTTSAPRVEYLLRWWVDCIQKAERRASRSRANSNNRSPANSNGWKSTSKFVFASISCRNIHIHQFMNETVKTAYEIKLVDICVEVTLYSLRVFYNLVFRIDQYQLCHFGQMQLLLSDWSNFGNLVNLSNVDNLPKDFSFFTSSQKKQVVKQVVKHLWCFPILKNLIMNFMGTPSSFCNIIIDTLCSYKTLPRQQSIA